MFTKVMKFPISHLREQGITVSACVDDLIGIADSYEQCLEDSSITVELLQKLGYVVNLAKSTLVPSQITEYLGVLINSQDMTFKILIIRWTPFKLNRFIPDEAIKVNVKTSFLINGS